METKTEILFLIKKNKEKHDSLKEEMLYILDEIDELGKKYDKKLEDLNLLEDEYVELWGKYNDAE